MTVVNVDLGLLFHYKPSKSIFSQEKGRLTQKLSSTMEDKTKLFSSKVNNLLLYHRITLRIIAHNRKTIENYKKYKEIITESILYKNLSLHLILKQGFHFYNSIEQHFTNALLRIISIKIVR